MIGRLCSFLVVAIALLATSPASSAPGRPVPGELIVKYRAGTPDLRTRAIRTRLQARTEHAFPFIRAEHLKLPAGTDVDAVIATLRADPSVEYAEPNVEWSISTVPDDSLFPQLWAMQNIGQTGGTPGADIHATAAWDLFTGDPNLMIGVIDTGIDWTHPDLAANVWTNPGEIPGNGIDDDGNGYVDDVHGYDFVNDDGDPRDDHGHGTHVAGTIAAVGNNGIGVTGVVWRASVVGIKILAANGLGTTATALAGLQYALRVGVRVTNSSWGGPIRSQALYDAIQALDSAGQIYVAAAGNDALNDDVVPNYPSGFDLNCIISVAATNANDRLASFSNYGPTSVDIAAPGTNILSLWPGGGYQSLSGTSMATPLVTGVVALAIGAHPGASAAFIKELVLAHADPLESLDGRVARGARLNAALPVQGADTIAPAVITDLRIREVGSNHVALAWTATGDDERLGRASEYDLRWSPTPIVDQTSFLRATRVVAMPRPRSAGSDEQFEIRDLASSSTYFIALEARDEFGNASSISNLVTAATLPGPRLAIAVPPLQATLVSGGTASGTLTVRNDGPGTLDFAIPEPGFALTTPSSLAGESWTSAGAGDDASGGTIETANPVEPGGPGAFAVGGPDAFGYRWTDNNGTGPAGPPFNWADITQVGQVVPIFGNDEVSAPIPIGFHFPYYGTLFTSLRVCTNGWVSLGDAEVPPYYDNRPLPDPSASAPNLLAPFWDDLDFRQTPHAYTWNDGSRFIVSWQAVWHVARGGPHTFELILYPSGEIRFLYYSMGKALNGATIGIQNGARTIGLTTAYNQLYVQSGLAIRYRPPHTWFSVSPAAGRLGAHESRDLTWRFDALGIGARSLGGSLNVLSNDPSQRSVSLPVRLDIIDAPDMASTPDSIDFGTSLVGNRITRTVTAWNPGSEPLVVSGFASSEPDLVVDPPAFTIAPQGFRLLTLVLSPTADRRFDGALAFATNDPDENPFRIAVHGIVKPAPVLQATAPTLVAALAKGLGAAPSFRDQPLVIENAGRSDLHWNTATGRGFWIRPVPESGTTPPGQRDTVTIRLDSSDVFDGDYAAELMIRSDDPKTPVVTFPASIHVGVAPAAVRTTPRTLHVPASGQSVRVTVNPAAGLDGSTVDAASVRLLRTIPASGPGQVARDGSVTFPFDRGAVQAAIRGSGRVPIELIARAGQTTWLAGTDTIDVTRGPGAAGPAELAPLPDRLALRAQGAHPSDRPALELALPRASTVDAQVFDAGGARVRVLAHAALDAGFHSLAWDGRDDQGRARPAGVYFVRVAALGEVLTRRVVKIE